jgi:glycosyltransferase involved in cell wall biosynthesis
MTTYIEKINSLVETVEDWSRLPAEPLVSVWMITYNHEPYIRQALDSVLMQEVDFAYEVVIGEDKSTDRTREIVIEYQRRHPEKIRLRLARENFYRKGIKHGLATLAACRGKYIARLDGDDFWIGRDRLMSMVSFLKKNPDFAIAFSNVDVVYDQSEQPSHSGYLYNHQLSGQLKRLPIPNETTTLSDMAKRAYIYGPAAVFLNFCLLGPLPDFLEWPVVGDWANYLAAARYGKIRYFPDLTAGYRVHAGGIWSTKTSLDRQKHHFIHYCSLARSSSFDSSLITFFRANAVSRYLSFEEKYPAVISEARVQEAIENLRGSWPACDDYLTHARQERASSKSFIRRLSRFVASIIKS